MDNNDTRKSTILIADDSKMNRDILNMMLEQKYEILEAVDGEQTLELIDKHQNDLKLILLDVIMPKKNGFDVLQDLQYNNLINKIPVIIISADTSTKTVTEAYNLGAIDFIARPFNMQIVQKRIENILLAHSKQDAFENKLKGIIKDKEKNNTLLINILSEVVEFRNGESANHVLNVKTITSILLKKLVSISNKYNITKRDISLISVASSLHDIGKISIDQNILNKPGKLTPKEFEVMKTHTTIGYNMMVSIPNSEDNDLIKFAKNICRYHHEKYDGNGYPDHLKGDEIPICAQVVSIADCYDALTSERVYKHAIPHDDAIQLINDGKCGVFNPLVLRCLNESSEKIRRTLNKDSAEFKIDEFTEDLFNFDDLATSTASNECLELVERERTKNRYYASMSKEIQWEYIIKEKKLTILGYEIDNSPNATDSDEHFTETVINPVDNPKLIEAFGKQTILDISQKFLNRTPGNPELTMNIHVKTGRNQTRWYKLNARVIFNNDQANPVMESYIGKLIDIDKEQQKVLNLEYQAHHDELTRLYNRYYSRYTITTTLQDNKDKKYALILFDIDHFKAINDTKGHLFGDIVLKNLSELLQSKILEKNTVVARTGGDEFIIFFTYSDTADLIQHTTEYHKTLTFTCDDTDISVSMGVTTTDISGYSFDKLMQNADDALYQVKNSGKNNYILYEKK